MADERGQTDRGEGRHHVSADRSGTRVDFDSIELPGRASRLPEDTLAHLDSSINIMLTLATFVIGGLFALANHSNASLGSVVALALCAVAWLVFFHFLLHAKHSYLPIIRGLATVDVLRKNVRMHGETMQAMMQGREQYIAKGGGIPKAQIDQENSLAAQLIARMNKSVELVGEQEELILNQIKSLHERMTFLYKAFFVCLSLSAVVAVLVLIL